MCKLMNSYQAGYRKSKNTGFKLFSTKEKNSPPPLNINTIILAAGKFNVKNISAGMITEMGLLPIRSKPAIAWVVDQALKNKAKDIKIILRKNSTRLSRFMNYRYPDIEQIFLDENEDMSLSLIRILSLCHDEIPTQVILGDTLINENFPSEPDVFLSSINIKASKNWCLVSKDSEGHMTNIYNKERDISLKDKEALVGYYKFSDTKLLKAVVQAGIKSGKCDFVNILTAYNQKRPVLIKTTDHWFDFGHISGAVQARLGLFSAREFNNLEVDAVRGTITKISAKKQKLLDEANWLQSLPPKISCYVPRVFKVQEEADVVKVEMELYGYASLAETFIYGSNNLEDWYNIIEALLKVHKVLEEYTEPADSAELEEIYITKTAKRLAEFPQAAPQVAKMMLSDYIVINNVHYRNWPLIKEKLHQAVSALPSYTRRTIVHGDYCFSNILFDPMHYIFKFIDPRGRFKTQTIYGDPRYDIAKLRHSVVGLYDFIVAGLYKLNKTGQDKYEFQVSTPILTEKLEPFFDELVRSYGYDSYEIRLIESLLFLTMIPLHADDQMRQQVFYLTAIKKLNEVLSDE